MLASSYHPIFDIVVVLLTIVFSLKYASLSGNKVKDRSNSSIFGLITALSFSIFIGLRPLSGRFVDMVNYNSIYYTLIYGNNNGFRWDTENLLFDNILFFLGDNKIEITIFFLIISLIYFGLTYISCLKLYPKDSIYAFICFLGAFSTFSYATNGIKAGAAAAIFICAIAYRRKTIGTIILLLLSFGMHHSMIVPVLAFLIAKTYKNTKFYLYFWLFSLLVALLNISFFIEFFAQFADEGGKIYLSDTAGNWGGKSGFRYDFVIYSFFPILVGYYTIYKQRIATPLYKFIFNIYLITNSVWMLCMHAAFTNRIAYLSWQLYPFVLVTPFFNNSLTTHYVKELNTVVWIQLLFTLTMTYIYYG